MIQNIGGRGKEYIGDKSKGMPGRGRKGLCNGEGNLGDRGEEARTRVAGGKETLCK